MTPGKARRETARRPRRRRAVTSRRRRLSGMSSSNGGPAPPPYLLVPGLGASPWWNKFTVPPATTIGADAVSTDFASVNWGHRWPSTGMRSIQQGVPFQNSVGPDVFILRLLLPSRCRRLRLVKSAPVTALGSGPVGAPEWPLQAVGAASAAACWYHRCQAGRRFLRPHGLLVIRKGSPLSAWAWIGRKGSIRPLIDERGWRRRPKNIQPSPAFTMEAASPPAGDGLLEAFTSGERGQWLAARLMCPGPPGVGCCPDRGFESKRSGRLG